MTRPPWDHTSHITHHQQESGVASSSSSGGGQQQRGSERSRSHLLLQKTSALQRGGRIRARLTAVPSGWADSSRSTMIKLPDLLRPNNNRTSPRSSTNKIPLEDPQTQRMFAHIPIPVGIITQEGNVLSTNSEFLRLIRVLRGDIRTIFAVPHEAELFLKKMQTCQSRSSPSSLGAYSCFNASVPHDDHTGKDSLLFEWNASFDVPSGLYVITAMYYVHLHVYYILKRHQGHSEEYRSRWNLSKRQVRVDCSSKVCVLLSHHS